MEADLVSSVNEIFFPQNTNNKTRPTLCISQFSSSVHHRSHKSSLTTWSSDFWVGKCPQNSNMNILYILHNIYITCWLHRIIIWWLRSCEPKNIMSPGWCFGKLSLCENMYLPSLRHCTPAKMSAFGNVPLYTLALAQATLARNTFVAPERVTVVKYDAAREDALCSYLMRFHGDRCPPGGSGPPRGTCMTLWKAYDTSIIWYVISSSGSCVL